MIITLRRSLYLLGGDLVAVLEDLVQVHVDRFEGNEEEGYQGGVQSVDYRAVAKQLKWRTR